MEQQGFDTPSPRVDHDEAVWVTTPPPCSSSPLTCWFYVNENRPRNQGVSRALQTNNAHLSGKHGALLAPALPQVDAVIKHDAKKLLLPSHNLTRRRSQASSLLNHALERSALADHWTGSTTGDCSSSTSTPKTFMGKDAFQTPVEGFSNAIVVPEIDGHTLTNCDDKDHSEFFLHDYTRCNDRIFLSLSKINEQVPPPFLDLEEEEESCDYEQGVDEQRTRREEHRARIPSFRRATPTDRRVSLFRPLAQRQQASC